ncbi:MAG: ras guanine nucleotide exchange factor domain-containing protein, partial [Piptocephalis tieghemiana]
RELFFNMDNQLIGGTWDALVERLTPHDSTVDLDYVAVFLLSFRQFGSPEKLLQSLMDRFNIKAPEFLESQEDRDVWERRKRVPIRLRVLNALRMWIEVYFHDQADPVILESMQTFAISQVEGSSGAAMAGMHTAASSTLSPNSLFLPKPISLTTPSSSSSGSSGSMITPSSTPSLSASALNALRARNLVTVTDVDALEVARQLTLLDARYYCRIGPYELIGQEFSRKDSRIAVHVRAMSQLSTRLTTWVSESILYEHDAKKRAHLVRYFLKVAERLSQIPNFQSLYAILSALNSSPITRLRKTWDLVPSKSKQTLTSLRRLTDHTRNYAEYRARLRSSTPPCLPFLGLFLTDLVFIADGNPDTRPILLINFDKYVKAVRVVQEVQKYQVPHRYQALPELQEYLCERMESSKSGGDPQELYRISQAMEPRQGTGGRAPSASLGYIPPQAPTPSSPSSSPSQTRGARSATVEGISPLKSPNPDSEVDRMTEGEEEEREEEKEEGEEEKEKEEERNKMNEEKKAGDSPGNTATEGTDSPMGQMRMDENDNDNGAGNEDKNEASVTMTTTTSST